jgi:hypothetical protein
MSSLVNCLKSPFFGSYFLEVLLFIKNLNLIEPIIFEETKPCDSIVLLVVGCICELSHHCFYRHKCCAQMLNLIVKSFIIDGMMMVTKTNSNI